MLNVDYVYLHLPIRVRFASDMLEEQQKKKSVAAARVWADTGLVPITRNSIAP